MINDYVPFSNINSHYIYTQYYVCDKYLSNHFHTMRSMTNHMLTEHLRILRHCLSPASPHISYDITEKMAGRRGQKRRRKIVLFTSFLLPNRRALRRDCRFMEGF